MPSFADALKRTPPAKPAPGAPPNAGAPANAKQRAAAATVKPVVATSHPPPKKKSKGNNSLKNHGGGGGKRNSTGFRNENGSPTWQRSRTKTQQQQQQQPVRVLKRDPKPSMEVNSFSDFPTLGAPSSRAPALDGNERNTASGTARGSTTSTPVSTATAAPPAHLRPKSAPWGQVHAPPKREWNPSAKSHQTAPSKPVPQRQIAPSAAATKPRQIHQTQPTKAKTATVVSGSKPTLNWATAAAAAKPKPGSAKQPTKSSSIVAPDVPSKKRKKKKKSSGTEKTPKPASSSILDAFSPKQRTLDDDPLYMAKFKVQSTSSKKNPNSPFEIKKGRQRLTPRKKKFTSLKKKILQERLEQWRESQKERGVDGLAANGGATTTVVILHEYATLEQVSEDEDEYEELVSFLQSMASKVGPIKHVIVPKEPSASGSDIIDAMVVFSESNDADAAQATWNGWILGGEPLRTSIVKVAASSHNDEASLVAAAIATARGVESKLTVQLKLHDILTEDDLEDDDCLEETLSDIRNVVGHSQTDVKFVPPTDVLATVTTSSSSPIDAQQLLDRLNETKLGGQTIRATLERNEDEESCAAKPTSIVVLTNVLTEDDLEDDDCLQETLRDIRALVEKSSFSTSDMRVADGNEIHITVACSQDEAQSLTQTLSGTVLGGQVLGASLLALPREGPSSLKTTVLLQNVLTEDDLEDEDCLEESLSDLKELASRWSTVDDVTIEMQTSVKLRIQGGLDIAKKVAESFHGMVIGGQTVLASIMDDNGTPDTVTPDLKGVKPQGSVITPTKSGEPEPMYSGDKLISERFAEMKRVPKIPTKPEPRDYAKVKAIDDETVKPLLTELLGELMRLQKRSQQEENNNNARARRRLVLGLREVARGIRAHKVKMVVMANNLDEYGALDAKLQELLDLAKAESVPVFFEFNKRKLGKALGKNIKIAVVGIQNADGAHAPYKKLQQLANRYGLV